MVKYINTKMIINYIYKHFYHEDIPDKLYEFISNILIVAMGIIPGTALLFILAIVAGRFLGPEGYGKYVLLQSIAMYLFIPMLFGMNISILKYLPSIKNSENEQKQIISSLFLLVAICIIISSLIFFTFSGIITDFFSIPSDIFVYSIIYAVLFSLFTIVMNILSSLFKMRAYAIYQVIYAIFLLSSFIVIYLNIFSFKALIYAQFIAYIVIIVLAIIFSIKKYFTFVLDKTKIYQLLSYGAVSVIGCLSYVVYTSIDKIFINKYLSLADVGLYGIYSIASVNVFLLFYNIFITVFFPSVSRSDDKLSVYNKINQFIPHTFLLGLPLLIILQYVILIFLGAQYPFDLTIATLFGIAAIIMCIFNIYTSIINSVGISGAKINTYIQVLLAILCIITNILLIPVLGIKGAIVSIIISYVIAILLIFFKRGVLSAK